MAELHIAISPETLFTIGEFKVTNTLFTSYLVTLLLIAFLLYARTQLKQTKRPTGLQNLLEAIVSGLYSFMDTITHSTTKSVAFAPVIIGFFLFILLNNWVELLPGFHTIVYTGQPGIHLAQVPQLPSFSRVYAADENSNTEIIDHAPLVPGLNVEDTEVTNAEDVVELESDEEIHETLGTTETDQHEGEGEHAEGHKGVALFRGANADINMTLALALVSVAAIQYFGFKFSGIKYGQKYINFSSPIFFFVGLLEIISEFSKIMSFAFRLFGNIFAGEVLIAVISYLIPVVLPMPFIGLEIFVGLIQALVFAMLSLVFINMATEAHH